jgi:competence CoiA-like predicted nuclease
MLRKMDKAKALTGECAGEEIKANEIDHKDCKAWKLYCPKCYQFVHLRKSNKINSSFAHYDVEDKSCKYRVESSSNNAATNINTNENQGQDLEGI